MLIENINSVIAGELKVRRTQVDAAVQALHTDCSDHRIQAQFRDDQAVDAAEQKAAQQRDRQ